MALISISAADARSASPERRHAWCAQLEAGDILMFPESPIPITADDLAFLREQQQTESSLHKNIAYKPQVDALSGVDAKSADAAALARMHAIMRGYSRSVAEFLAEFLAPYQRRWRLDYASFRPQEEHGRDLPLRRRNDLLHTDAFPTRPTNGARILRFFNNIHPTRTRDWVVGDPFRTVAAQFAGREIALPRAESGAAAAWKRLGRGLGLGAVIPSLKRSPYDDFMMRFHNFLKENSAFQRSCRKQSFQFPPGSSWMVYTDTAPHAVLAGQYALEQTFLVAPEAMVAPEHAPLRVLEEMTGTKLVAAD